MPKRFMSPSIEAPLLTNFGERRMSDIPSQPIFVNPQLNQRVMDPMIDDFQEREFLSPQPNYEIIDHNRNPIDFNRNPIDQDRDLIDQNKDILDQKVRKVDRFRESNYFNERPIQTHREKADPIEPISHQYQDILTSRENAIRLSCPREIKPDPDNIDSSILLLKNRKKLAKKPKKKTKKKKIY